MKNLGRARYALFPPEASLHFHLDDPLPGSPATRSSSLGGLGSRR
jgi:hypothetical protein